MWRVKATIYRDYPHADAQCEVALVEVAAVYIFHGAFLQRRIINIFGVNGWEKAYSQTIRQAFNKLTKEWINLGTLKFEKGFYRVRNSIFAKVLLFDLGSNYSLN